jgi:hypothetical protein
VLGAGCGLFLLLTVSRAGAQQISGSVRDSSGRGIVGAVITVADTGRRAIADTGRRTLSGSDGHFSISDVQTGTRQVTIRADEFVQDTRKADVRAGEVTDVGVIVLQTVYPREVWFHCGVTLPADEVCEGGRLVGLSQGALNGVLVIRDSVQWHKFVSTFHVPVYPYPPARAQRGISIDWSRGMLIVIGYPSMDNLLAGSYRSLNRAIYDRTGAVAYLGPDSIEIRQKCCIDGIRPTQVYEVPRTAGSLRFEYILPRPTKLELQLLDSPSHPN